MDKTYNHLEKRISPDDAHYFFGYFDKCPWNSRGEHPAHRVTFSGRQPYFGEAAEFGIVHDGKFEKRGETRAWCWQQGAMLQWFDNDRLIWNDVEGDHHVARLSDGTVFSRPIYTISPDRHYALSLNFSRLDVERPGYGYPGLPDKAQDFAYPDFDGLTLMNLKSGKNELVVSLSKLVHEFPAYSCDLRVNWVNHLLFSPDGKRISFIHRWRIFNPTQQGNRSYVTRMFTANRDGSDLWMLPIDFHASHYTWFSPDKMIVFSRLPNGGDQYRIYTVGNNIPEIFAPGRLPSDGHCSFSPNGKLLLTDSYPDAKDIRELVLYDPSKDVRYSLGRYYAPPVIHPTRCDLHPRWSADGRCISFDSFHEKFRGVYTIDLPEEVLS